MKKSIFSLLLAALALTNCSKDEEAVVTPVVDQPAFTIYATPDSRTANDGMNTKWVAGDEVNVFHAETGSTEYVNDTPYTNGAGTPFVNTDAANGVFEGKLAAALDADKAYDWYMFYPYGSYIATPANTDAGYSYVGAYYTAAQKQTGNNSMAHIAGNRYPLYGKATNVAAAATPLITMKHASSLVEFVVKNPSTATEDIVVSEIEFTAPESIIGQYFINFAGESLIFTDREGYTAKSATLTVQNGTAIAPGSSAKFYMAIKPFTVTNGELTVAVTANGSTSTKSISNVTTSFVAGKIKTITTEYVATVIEAQTWSKMTSVDQLAEGEYVLLVTNGADTPTIGYLPAVATSPNPAFAPQTYFDLTTNSVSAGIPDAMRWTFSYDAVTLTWKLKTKDGVNYLYGTNTAQGLNVGTTEDAWKISSHSKNAEAFAFVNDSYARNIGVYWANPSWRQYASDTNDGYGENGIGAQIHLYYCGTIPAKTALTTPTVTAVVENTTSIVASWGAVAGAANYTVTCGNKTALVSGTTYTFADLMPSTEYTISVVANPANINQHKASVAGTATATTEGSVEPYIELTGDNMAAMTNAGTSYNTEKTYTIGTYIWKSNGLQSDKYLQLRKKDHDKGTSYIQLPVLPSAIKKITLTVTNATATTSTGTASTALYEFIEGGAVPTEASEAVVSGGDSVNGANEVVLDLSSYSHTTGYIVLAESSGGTRIWNIRVDY